MAEEKTSVLLSSEFQEKLEKLKEDQPCLVLISGAPLGKKFPVLPPRVVIGRGEHVELRVQESSVSREHAELEINPKNSIVTLTDLRSTNGTYVNDVPIDSVQLKEGDIIRMGTTIFKFLPRGNIENIFVDKMHNLANIDAHTQAYNKKYLLEHLEHEFVRCRSLKKSLALLLFDLDFFKKVNDKHGHLAGDYVLEEVCKVLKKNVVRGDDILGRYGGEEFMIILPNTDLQAACTIGERIRLMIEDYPFQFEGTKIPVTLSLGVAALDTSIESIESLIKRADHALYNAKNSGRNRVCAN
ncbi:MAG: GGDEF domain-containing protein [Deltaproteobacteria bacterium]|nr:GGDEF domain-containing protein [Deltaproteobacteria bacterium]